MQCFPIFLQFEFLTIILGKPNVNDDNDDNGDGGGDADDDDDNDDDIGQQSPVTSLRAQPPISFGPDTSAKLTHNTNIKQI